MPRELQIRAMAHLTCVGHTADEIGRILDDLWKAGIRNVLALRGDPQGGIGSAFTPHPMGYANSTELVAGIRRVGDFEVSVSAYPEKHPEASSLDFDIDVLKAKVDAGATRAITQFFFENDCYLRFLDRARYRGVTIPIVPGIVPVQNFKQTANFAKRAGASVPQWLADRFEGTRTIRLVEPPDAWGGRAAVRWSGELASGSGFDAGVERVVDVARVLDAIYGR